MMMIIIPINSRKLTSNKKKDGKTNKQGKKLLLHRQNIKRRRRRRKHQRQERKLKVDKKTQTNELSVKWLLLLLVASTSANSHPATPISNPCNPLVDKDFESSPAFILENPY